MFAGDETLGSRYRVTRRNEAIRDLGWPFGEDAVQIA